MENFELEMNLRPQKACHFKADEEKVFQFKIGQVCTQNQIRSRKSCLAEKKGQHQQKMSSLSRLGAALQPAL